MKAFGLLIFTFLSLPSFAGTLTSTEYDPFHDTVTYKPALNDKVDERHYQKSYDLEIRFEYYNPKAIFGIGNLHLGPLKTTVFAGKQFQSDIDFKQDDFISVFDKREKSKVFYNMADGVAYVPVKEKFEKYSVGVRYVPDKYKISTQLERGHAIVLDVDLEVMKKLVSSVSDKLYLKKDREELRKKLLECFEHDKKLLLDSFPDDQKDGYLYPRMVVGRVNNLSLRCADGKRLALKIKLTDNDPECLP